MQTEDEHISRPLRAVMDQYDLARLGRYQNTGFDGSYAQRDKGQHRQCEFDHIDELVNCNGTHIHIWVPPGTRVAQILGAINLLKRKRDVVAWSWSLIPTPEQPT